MVQRYEFIDSTPWENPTGKWVRQADHAAELATLRAEVDRLREALEMFAHHYPRGINPYLDRAASLAKEALK